MTVRDQKLPTLNPEEFGRAKLQWLDWASGILLVVLGFIFLIDIVALLELICRLGRYGVPELIAGVVLTVFLSTVPLTILFFFLAGLGYIQASVTFLKWLGGITITQVAAMAATVVGYYLKK